MEQLELDILCVNSQTEIGLEACVLVDLLENGDKGSVTFANNLIHLNSLMKAIKDVDVDSGELTDQEQMEAQEKIHRIIQLQRKFYDQLPTSHYIYFNPS